MTTRASIVDAAQKAFYDHGVAHASLDEIARRAGVTRGAVYWHFENKFALLNAIFEDAGIPLDPFLISPAADATKTVEALIDAFGTCWRAATRSRLVRRLYTLVFTRCEDARETAAFCERIRQASRCAEQNIEVWLCRAMSNGQLPIECDTRTIARVIHATLSGLLRKSLIEPNHRNLDVVVITNIVRTLLP